MRLDIVTEAPAMTIYGYYPGLHEPSGRGGWESGDQEAYARGL